MRPIKFRVWDKDNNVMRFDGFLITTDGVCGYCDSDGIFHDDKNLILMQFTGLLDRNGKEIYEGDILKFTKLRIKQLIDAERDTLLVGFNNGSFMCGRSKDPYYMNTYLFLCSSLRTEIIGNLYENPELLDTLLNK